MCYANQFQEGSRIRTQLQLAPGCGSGPMPPFIPRLPKATAGFGAEAPGVSCQWGWGANAGGAAKAPVCTGRLVLAALRVCAGEGSETAENPCKRRRRTGAGGQGRASEVNQVGGGLVRRNQQEAAARGHGPPAPKGCTAPRAPAYGECRGCGDHTASQDPR